MLDKEQLECGLLVQHNQYGLLEVLSWSESGKTIYGKGPLDVVKAFSPENADIYDPTPKHKKKLILTREQKARKWVNELREMPIVWAWVGWLASHSARLRASAPEHLQSRESENLNAIYGVTHEIGVTLTGNKNYTDADGRIRGAQGLSYTVVYDDFGFAPEFEARTGIVARPTEHTQGKLSTQQWQPVLVLLLSDLKFRLSAKRPAPEAQQDLEAIKAKVPAIFKEAFDRGVRGEFASYFVVDAVASV